MTALIRGIQWSLTVDIIPKIPPRETRFPNALFIKQSQPNTTSKTRAGSISSTITKLSIMATGPPTVTQLKERFINSQTTLLSNPPQPSASFRATNERSDQPLDPRQLNTVAQTLEHLVKDHCRRIYAPQANRALAEQINEGYNHEVESRLEKEREGEDAIGRELDLGMFTCCSAWAFS